MNYVLDLSCIDKSASGAKQRILSIYKNIILENKNINFTLIYTDALDLKKNFNFNNVTFHHNPFNQSNYFNKILSVIYVYFYLTFNKKNYDIVEHFTLPFIKIKKSKNIITIHDLRKIYFSKSFFTKYIFKLFYNFFLKSASQIIVVSNSAKKELQSYFEIKKKIIVSYNVLSDNYLKSIKKNELSRIKKKYKLPKKFIISVGHLEKRKNFINLIKAVKILKDNNFNVKLVLIGNAFDQYNLIQKEIIGQKLKSCVKIYINLSDYELRCFYKLANIYVYPSLYEGFGIPMLESMASNLPMVLSNSDIFKEITNYKYQYFDPYDPLSIANKIKFVLKDNKMKKKMKHYGKKRLRIFKPNYQSKGLIQRIIN